MCPLLSSPHLKSPHPSATSMEDQLKPQSIAIVAFDATRDLKEHELWMAIYNIRMRGGILACGDTLLVLGVLSTFSNPMGYQHKACTDSFFGTNARALEEEVLKKVDSYVKMLQESAAQCEDEGIDVEVKITAGTPLKNVIFQEVISCNASWIILDRHLRRDFRFYERHVPSKVAIIEDSLSIQVRRSHPINPSKIDVSEQKFYSLSKSVEPSSNIPYSVINEQTVISCGSFSASTSSLENSDAFGANLISSSRHKPQEDTLSVYDETATSSRQESKRNKDGHQSIPDSKIFSNQNINVSRYEHSEKPILCAGCGLRTALYVKQTMKFKFSDIQAATSDFAKANLLGEGGFGHVYRGCLKDGQVIAAKMRKEESSQGYTEFRSEIQVLSFARHKNIVMLLGYCIKENHTIVVYEYICNKSLDWHLHDKSAAILEWHKRHAVAIGIAKGLRFLHEECRGGPIIHRDLRPSNILLTHDFVPMLGDFGLAKWKINSESVHTRLLGTLGYLAPEYVENGIVSVRTDVYAFGIVLLQLISGRQVFNEKEDGQHQSLLQWAEPLIESLALHELIDHRIGESYDTHELYHMAKAAYLCVRRKAEMRPSMAEVVRLLEGSSEHMQDLVQQFMPHYTK